MLPFRWLACPSTCILIGMIIPGVQETTRSEFVFFPPEHTYRQSLCPGCPDPSQVRSSQANTVLLVLTFQKSLTLLHHNVHPVCGGVLLNTQNWFPLLVTKHPNAVIYHKDYRKASIASTGGISRAKVI